ncbi:helix-turn-helix transcriptional regulator [Sporosarcina sp. Te-1]|uniref:helix-turn-helix domain-containing protein n=1 Tax=Sporosarcina sp. Te-1 TaxID=2818390 RepID=UPI001A9FB1BF|nr:helix-turn-helix transcriptional regulator [Sporosarcina sp. Te-1]QTD40025.1 helix-turn-helix transcriptional regulator [Sporosarcina sp. Te-1]
MVGALIKIERLKQNLKLEALARGICSTSHLSRIENGKVQVSDDIKCLLEARLGVGLIEEKQQKYVDITDIENRYAQAINFRDGASAAKLTCEISEMLTEHTFNFHTRIDLELLALRMKFVIRNNKDVLQVLSTYFEMQQELTPVQNFRIYQMQGMALYTNGQFKDCLEAYAKATLQMERLQLSSFERADLAFAQAVAFVANEDPYNALEQSRTALHYFQSIMAIRRVVECHIICGIAHKKNGQTLKALDMFKFAEQICLQNGLESFLGIVHQNIGDVFSEIRETEIAISHFKKAMNYKEKPLELMYTILSLIVEYERIKEYENASHWLEKGYYLLPKLSRKKREYYETHFNVYQALCGEDIQQLEKALKTAVGVFSKRRNEAEWKDYAKRLAKFYVDKRMYKKAVYYYELILDRSGIK